MTDLAQNLATSAKEFPDLPALRLGDTTPAYAQFDDRADPAASRIAALGADRGGDRAQRLVPQGHGRAIEVPVREQA